MTALRWEKLPGPSVSFHAYSGEVIIAQIGQRDDGSCWYSISAVHMKWIAKGSDLDVGSIATARRAVNRGWAAWLDAAGLTPRA